MKPVLAITMGDPAGVGPEITMKLLYEYRGHVSTVDIYG